VEQPARLILETRRAPFPMTSQAYVEDGGEIPVELVRSRQQVLRRVRDATRTVLVQTWKKNPHTKQWRMVVSPVFLTGGGAGMGFYQRLVDHAVAEPWQLRLGVASGGAPLNACRLWNPLVTTGTRLPRMLVRTD